MRVAAIDQDVARLEQRDQFDDHVINRGACLDHNHDLAWRLERRDQLFDRVRATNFLPLARPSTNASTFAVVRLNTATVKPWLSMFKTRFSPITARPTRPMSAVFDVVAMVAVSRAVLLGMSSDGTRLYHRTVAIDCRLKSRTTAARPSEKSAAQALGRVQLWIGVDRLALECKLAVLERIKLDMMIDDQVPNAVGTPTAPPLATTLGAAKVRVAVVVVGAGGPTEGFVE